MVVVADTTTGTTVSGGEESHPGAATPADRAHGDKADQEQRDLADDAIYRHER